MSREPTLQKAKSGKALESLDFPHFSLRGARRREIIAK